MKARQESDNIAWDRSDDLWDESLKEVRLSSTCRKVESFAQRIKGKPATFIRPLIAGGFNVLYPFEIEDSVEKVLIRLPVPNQALFPEEKTLAEAATAAYIHQHTRLPVPKVLYNGIDPEVGPFIVYEDLGRRRHMGRLLETPRDNPNDTPVLNPNHEESKLKSLYLKMARCVLQLSVAKLPRIGGLVKKSTNPESYDIQGRPLTCNMSNMVQLSNIPSSIFPPKGTTFATADEWYVALADMHIGTLLFQHNDMVESEDDARNKYVARQLFRRLAKQGRLSTYGFAEDDWSAYSKNNRSGSRLPAPGKSGPFPLWCDDFRPVNVMVDDDDEVIGVIDWEFAYAAPTQFTLDSPWWLLLDVPEMWFHGVESWAEAYEKVLGTWLGAMEEAEREVNQLDPGLGSGGVAMSKYMRESWETGRFWLNYAARKSWAFDCIYWKYLDERFFGERAVGVPEQQLWKTRVRC